MVKGASVDYEDNLPNVGHRAYLVRPSVTDRPLTPMTIA